MMGIPTQKGSPVAVLDAVQELADGLAEELKRSVAVDDPTLRLLVSSAHYENVDGARMNSLLGRRIEGPTLDYVMEAGALEWREPTRLDAHPGLGVEFARWGFPLRSRYGLMGFMWLIDDGSITDDELEVASETARRIEDILARQTQSAASSDPEVEALIDGLLSRENRDREKSADDLRDRGMFLQVTSLAVLVVRNTHKELARDADAEADVVRRGLTSALQNRLSESFAFSASGDDSVVIVGSRREPSTNDLTALATAIHVEIQRVDPSVSSAVSIGVGSPVASLTEIRSAYEQAAVAADVAIDRRQVAAAWDSHQLEGLLRACLKPELTTALVPKALHTLRDQPEDTLQMIATYLDNAGNVNATADLMHLHRTTVYYRLTKFKERTGLDMDDGETRLLVHFWFTARDLIGLTD